jgi:4-hydroxy 2-oxovalerate aldolase
MKDAGIDVVELGFRFQPKSRFLGAHAYTTDSYLKTLEIPNGMRIGVMINAADIVNHSEGPTAAINELFGLAEVSPVKLVRIASHFSEVTRCRPVVEHLKELGYNIGFNLMQASGRNADNLAEVAREVSSWNSIDVLYFADSLGNMDGDDVANTLQAFSQKWSGDMGIHAHDNMSRALSNSMAAIDAGATWVDATVYGMGRGPGNLRMEYLLLELARRGETKYNGNMLFELVLGGFQSLVDKYQWGPNLFYFLSAAYNIHPTYIQEMLRLENYNAESAISAIEQLRKSDAKSFNIERLKDAMRTDEISFPGTWAATGWAKGQTVLLIGSGPWVQRNLDNVINYITETEPTVICLNTNSSIPENLIDAFAACHELRFAMEAAHYKNLTSPLIVPIQAVSDDLKKSSHSENVLDYGMNISRETFEANETGCTIPYRLAAAYGLAVATAAGAKEILLAGFDGYEAGKPHEEMEVVFNLYRMTSNAVPIISVTPTTYSINQSSIFAPRAKHS